MRRALTLSAVVLLLAGCTTQAPAPRPSPVAATSKPSPTPAPPALTIDEAAEAADVFLGADDVIRSMGDGRMALERARDGQDPLALAEYRSSENRPIRFSWGPRKLIVPRLPKGVTPWFAAVAERRHGKERQTSIMTFMKEGQFWQRGFTTLLNGDAVLPEVETDAEGYATLLDARDQSIAISPNLLGPLHATVAEEGPKGFTSGLIEAGPLTNGFFDDIALQKKIYEKAGYDYISIFAAAASYPVQAVRTADGGGLLFYTLTRTTQWIPVLPNALGGHLPIPADAKWDLTTTEILKDRRIQETQQFLALVPPRTSEARAEIIAYDGRITQASATE
ncbi:hypothetical protein [Herbidospora mongoliensis]|uniref:hypothetical protein n=1 Tax=Herbidospora mongoliensis TaxID=688067 RepID=UPI00083329E6|nr:hypothetical protein [Herbidospora mongoliensis]